MINLNIKNYGTHEFNKGITTKEVMLAVAPELKKTIFLGKLNGEWVGMDEQINESGDFKFRFDTNSGCSWNSANDVAAKSLFQYLKDNGMADELIEIEVSEDGFDVSFTSEKNISANQLDLINGKVLKLMSKSATVDSPLETRWVKFMKLRSVSGLTTTDKNANKISGLAAMSKEALETNLEKIEDRESRDHRRIGKKLELFTIDQTIGKGLPVWLPNGVILKRQIKEFLQKLEFKFGYQELETPIIGSSELYKTSGHYYHYKDSMYPEMINKENEHMMLRPMSCPHHCMVYKTSPKSYRDLPVRYSEQVKQFRYESSGALIGLERVRAMELTDSHIFLTEDQLEKEISSAFEIIKIALKKFDIEISYIELALFDPADKEKYHGDIKFWETSQDILRNFLDTNNIEYKSMIGEAAFYGPKIDVQIKTALGHTITVSTIQLDFLLPEKFDLLYKDSNGEQRRPIMIHKGLIGTYERFISVLLEQTKGNLPMWLSPKQVVILPVSNEHHLEYATSINEVLLENNIRSSIDSSDERLSFKIRKHQTAKTSIEVIIGDKEIESKTVTFRRHGAEDSSTVTMEEFTNLILEEIK